MLTANFWYLNSENELVLFSQHIGDDKAFKAMVSEVQHMTQILESNNGTTFTHVLVKYEPMNEEKVGDVELDDIDWVEAECDDLDILNYYLTKTVGENYLLGYRSPEEKDRFLDKIHKMQDYAKSNH